MDHVATLTLPAETVFAHLADPGRLGDWLPQVVRVDLGLTSAVGIGSAFSVTMHTSQGDRDLDAEVAAHQPPWLIAYRLMTQNRPVLVRVTCTTQAGGTQVRVQQTEDTEPLLIDLTRVRAGAR